METVLGILNSIAHEIKLLDESSSQFIEKLVGICEKMSIEGSPKAAKYAIQFINNILSTSDSQAKLFAVAEVLYSYFISIIFGFGFKDSFFILI